MLAKDVEDCGNCPLLGNHCSGGMTSDGTGRPIEPPCASWDPEDEISEEDMDVKVESMLADIEEDRQYEEALRIKKEEKKKRVRESKLLVYRETYQINRLRKQYKLLARLKSFSSVMEITREITREPKDLKSEVIKAKVDTDMEDILDKIDGLKKIKKQKLNELKKRRLEALNQVGE